ncbi:MAG: lysophospholipid acyltransferase family protein [Ignavibacteriales bacterium]|nr:lysophospholipid acyltransferase family protein [Ignavibacteriales bacterium]
MKLSDFQRNILRYIGIQFASAAIRVLIKTLRIKIINGETISKFASEKKNFVSAFWHGSMMIGWYIHRNENAAALVSQSKDGEVLAKILEKWNYKVIRGSSSIGGNEALSVMIDLIRENHSLAITPDGPQGPIYKMKAGAVVSAKKTNVPLFLTGIGIKKKFILKSWDHFEVPKPFSKVVVLYSDPVLIDDSFNYDETNQKIIECEALLNKLQKDALQLC